MSSIMYNDEEFEVICNNGAEYDPERGIIIKESLEIIIDDQEIFDFENILLNEIFFLVHDRDNRVHQVYVFALTSKEGSRYDGILAESWPPENENWKKVFELKKDEWNNFIIWDTGVRIPYPDYAISSALI